MSISSKLFGKESAVGRRINWGNQTKTIGAVYRDFPANTIVTNYIYFPLPADMDKNNNAENYHAYIRVDEAHNATYLFENFKRSFDAQAVSNMNESGFNLRLTVLSDIRYVTDAQFDRTPKANKQALSILFAISIIIVVIAGINFTNFSTALSPMRIKNINTQRILGALQQTIRLAIVSEAVFFSILSYFIAILFVLILKNGLLTGLVDANLSLISQPFIVVGTFLVALLTGLFAGVYPALYLTSFEPAFVLKGNFGLSPKGKKIRNTLIGIQYTSSFVLIIIAFFMYLQNSFMQNSFLLGYQKDNVVTVDIGIIQDNREVFTNQIKAYSGVEDVTFGETLLSNLDQYMKFGKRYKGEFIDFQCLPIHYTFLKVMGIEIKEGRDFRQEDEGTLHGAYIFNESARNKYNLELNTVIDNDGEITGFISDIKFTSFRMEVEPMAFYVWGTQNWGTQPNQAYIKLKAGTNNRSGMSHINYVLSQFDSNYPFNVRFYDDVLQQTYEKEISLSLLISLFSFIAIFISIVGVFGLVVFDSECRRKEIGVRKVFGASTLGIIVMFNKAYLKILAICFVVAVPLAWYTVNRWLENFAYKTPMHWWAYLLAFVAVGAITVCTVTFQNWRVANDDPVKSIKSE